MKTKNPINVDNIVYLLNQQNYTTEKFDYNINNPNRFSIKDYTNIFLTFIDYFFESYEIKDIIISDDRSYGTTLINDKLRNYWHTNICKISFNALYPNIIVKLYEKGKLKFNIDEFAIIYSFMVKNIKEIKNHKDIKDVSKLLFKFLINYTYGAISNSKFSKFYVDKHHLICEYIHHPLVTFKNDYIDNIIYVDTDEIYLDFLTKEIKEQFDWLELPYEVIYGINGFFLEKKKFIIDKNNSCKVRGIQEYKSKYKLQKNRLYKISRLLKIISNI